MPPSRSPARRRLQISGVASRDASIGLSFAAINESLLFADGLESGR